MEVSISRFKLHEMKKALFTVNFGNYDVIKKVPIWPDWDSILITNSGKDDNRFTRTVQTQTNNPELDSRYWKWCSHITLPEYDTVMYYDANLEIIRKPSQDHFHIVHEVRKSVREELDALIIQNHRWDRESLEAQWQVMINSGFKDDQGLFLNGFFGRDNRDPEMNHLCDDIWNMCEYWTNRDMLALPFLLYINSMTLPNQVKRSFFSHHVRRPSHKGIHPILTIK